MSPLTLRNAPAMRTKPLRLTTWVSGHFGMSLFVAVLVAAIGSSADTARGVQPNVSITTLPTTITQNFDTLPASGNATWVNDSTLLGWYHARTGTGTTIVANDGS